MLKRMIAALFLLGFAGSLAACGDTWRGAKEDTSENFHKAGDAVK